MKAVAAIVVSAVEQLAAEVRDAYSRLREAEVQVEKSAKRFEDARKAADLRRLELGRALLKARAAFPERGPKAKGWGELLEREGISQSTAWRYMELAGGNGGGAKPAEISFTDDRLNEIPHPSEVAGELGEHPDPPRKAFGRMLDMQLLLGRWQDVLTSNEVGKVDTLISDPPYSKRTHNSKPTRDDGSDPDGMTPNYAPWDAQDVLDFVEYWSPRVRGWMNLLCDDELIPVYRAAYERVGRVAFAPVPCIIHGMSVRTRGDGPSSTAVYSMVARPAGAEFAKWGTLPGDYGGNKEHGAKHGRGKPRWLTDAFVRDYTREGDLVCDPLAGYGGTLISALLMKRRAIGAESDAVAVEEAFRRANATQTPSGIRAEEREAS